MFENKLICAKCGGECCKGMPGSCFPSDFNLPGDLTKLNQAIESGRYCIDWWDGDPREDRDEIDRGYFVRPATADKVGVKYDPTWGGTCCLLGEDGCTLPEDERPLNCQKLEPIKDGECILHGNSGKREAALAWIPYYKELDKF